jgi:hypothetical protein
MPRLSRRLVRNHDIPRLNSRVVVIRIQRDNGPVSAAAGFPGGAGKGARAVLCHPGDLPKSQVAGHLPGPLRAVCGRPGPAGGPRRQLAVRPGCGPRRRAGNRTRAVPPPASGYASLCWPTSVPAVRSRAVWGRQGDWLSGRALRSHRRGRWFEPSIAHSTEPDLRPGQKLDRTGLILAWRMGPSSLSGGIWENIVGRVSQRGWSPVASWLRPG